MTTAPGLIQSAVTCSGRPIAAIRMSASRAMAAGSLVAVWQTVTVASPPAPFLEQQQRHRLADDLRPAQDHGTCAPRVSTPAWISSSRIPSGVHGTNRGVPMRQQARR